MAFVTVSDTEGRPHIVHTSMFDAPPPRRRPDSEWADVWVRLDGQSANPKPQDPS